MAVTIKKYPSYGVSANGHYLWKLNSEASATRIADWSNELSVAYGYKCTANMQGSEDATLITRKEFYERVEDIKKKHGVKFTIK
jgi:starvation-inducible outer membrane lipoprotein